jgi:hypothetical protein
LIKRSSALLTSAAVAAAVAIGTLTFSSGSAAAADDVRRSGLPWSSGVFIPGDSPTAHESFGTWRGAKTDVVVTWPARRTWNDFVNPAWLYDRWKSSPQTLVLGLPPFPEGVGGSLGACASGAYDGYWRSFGQGITAAGLADRSIIRLGWEFNGNWYAWSARNPAEFAACWRKVHTAAEAAAPGLRWDWNTNRGPSQLGIDSRNAYPGDAYVDIVGVDSYDGWPGATTEATWNEHYNGAYGLKFWADFARAHGKKFSVPEWGVYPGTAWAGHNGGDNPFYIAKMFRFFTEQKDNLAYEAYFNEPDAYYAGALSLNPKAAAEYVKGITAAKALAATSPAPVASTAPATTAPATSPTVSPTATATTAPTVTVTHTATATVTHTATVTSAPVTVTAPPVTVTATVTAPPVTVTVTAAPVSSASETPVAKAPVAKQPVKKKVVKKKVVKKKTKKAKKPLSTRAV